jgi:hypothetical protein
MWRDSSLFFNYRALLCSVFVIPLTIVSDAVPDSLRTSPDLNKAPLTWERHIEPLFDRECVKCHGPLKKKGGLDLSTFQNVIRGGDSGSVITPGAPSSSPLLQFLKAGSDPHMPPKKQLADEDLRKIETWIAHLNVTRSEIGSLEVSQSDESSSVSIATSEMDPQDFDHLPPHHIIDYFIRAEWTKRRLVPSPICDDRTFVRRSYLDLTGTTPSSDIVQRFLFDPTHDKRQRLVRTLLEGNRYAKNMAETFDLILLGRKGTRTEKNKEKHGWLSYLEKGFSENRPWNETMREIILARQTSSADKSEDTASGALWFVYEQRNDHQSIAESLAPLAFGTQIKCAQCHNHPLAHEIKQAHYWGMVAAFNRSQNVDTDSGIGVAESAIGGFINFANLEQESQPARLVFLNGIAIDEIRPQAGEKETDSPTQYVIAPAEKDTKPNKASIPRFSRRESLAEAVTESNPLLAKAFVNHLWALLVGRGLVHPVDEINSKHAPSHPELLNWLAKHFESTNYDIKNLIETITLSLPYQLSSSASSNHLQNLDSFACGIEKPMKAETLFRILLTATGHEPDRYSKEFPSQTENLRSSTSKQFPDLLPVDYQATLQQAMFLTNSPEIDHLLEPRPGNTTHRLLSIKAGEDRIQETFLAVLGRFPDQTEIEVVSSFLSKRPEKATQAQKQFMWSLLSSPEFLMNR